MKRVVVILSVFSVVFLGVTTLQAGQPDKYTFSGGGQVWVGDCPGFEVWEDATWEAVEKDYYNKDGEWVKSKIHWTIEGYVFNFDFPDNRLYYKNSVYTEHYDVASDEDRYTGLWALLTVPGYGSIFIDVGVVTFSGGTIVFEAGKHQWWDSNVDALCEHLAE